MNDREIIIYTTDDCPYCVIAEEIIKQVVSEYSGLFNYKSVNVSKSEKQQIISVPTIKIGSKVIEGVPEKDQIHTALFS